MKKEYAIWKRYNYHEDFCAPRGRWVGVGTKVRTFQTLKEAKEFAAKMNKELLNIPYDLFRGELSRPTYIAEAYEIRPQQIKRGKEEVIEQ